MPGYTNLLASKKGGTLYCGVTSELPRRLWEHREEITGGFTSRYGVKRLVWYEEFPWIIDAIKREKRSSRGRGHGRSPSSRRTTPIGMICRLTL